MNRSALVFLAGVFLPSLVLGWLALRTLGEQQIILERRTAELFQSETDSLALLAREMMAMKQVEFADEVEALLAQSPAATVAAGFSSRSTLLSPEAVMFAISADGRLTGGPPASSARREEDFLRENRSFLAGGAATEVYQALPERKETLARQAAPGQKAPPASSKAQLAESKEYAGEQAARRRNVVPQKLAESAEPPAGLPAAIEPEFSDFQNATASGASGILARFVNDRLQWFFWTRPEGADGITFGGMVPSSVIKAWMESLPARTRHPELCFAILDERGRPVMISQPDFEADWRRPFVATEMGDVLPYWEAAAYLLDPAMLDSATQTSRVAILAVIALALAAIVAAGFFVVRDARQKLDLASKKTGFVSNVSHELKTPLTAIRMFAELLQAGAIDDPAKRTKYLRIITLESERLTRLINNVLDFARMDKKHKTYQKKPVDLYPWIGPVWEGVSLHLSESGWSCVWQASDGPYPVMADPDAISQILVNLLSNGEKYGAEAKSLELHTWKEKERLHLAILDRGPGVAIGRETKIFEAFYRADDSLASGIPGSGLGLTLANRIAKDHGGEVTYSPRKGGGSCFTLLLPLIEEDRL
ncbi:MAG: HAMP domain-containing sensor histidine kinase [Terrimicrobiaceae bacterium]